MIPVGIAMSGYKSLGEVGKVRKEINIKKVRCLYFRDNRCIDQQIEVKDDIYLIDPYKERLFFKKNAYLDDKLQDLIVVTDGHPVSLDLAKAKMDYVVETSEVVKVEDVDEKTKKLTYKRAIYTPVNIHQFDSVEGKVFGNISKKVIMSRVFDALDPTPRQELIMSLLFGILIGGFVTSLIMYAIKP
jgi:hypothetical protein